MEFYHEPIMATEILDGLAINPSDVCLDCTTGGAGHSSLMLERVKTGRLIGLDKDDDALKYSAKRLGKIGINFVLKKCDFKDFERALDELCVDKVDKILVDLGVSSHQIDTPERGFSFRFDGPLDMRMDTSQPKTAWHVVNFYPKEKLVKILREFGEERYAPQIVAGVLAARKQKTIDTTKELNAIIEKSVPKKYVFSGAGKKTFQAIRIEVNGELEGLENALKQMIARLNKGGRLAVLTFHSLEDRIVKNVFREASADCLCPPDAPICICGHKKQVEILTKKPLVASKEELERNPRASSAKLRIVEKI